MASLAEQYRPRVWQDVVGQDKVARRVDALRRRGLGGRAFWITGQSGTGKTTIARLIAGEIADELHTRELDAGQLTPAVVRDIAVEMCYGAVSGPGGRAYIVNEAHGLRKDVVRQLLVLLEPVAGLPDHVVFIFTTTNDGQESLLEDHIDGSPLLSRCVELSLAQRNLARGFAERARAIAQAEQLDGKPIERYVRLVQDKHNNMRAVLQAIESGGMLD